MFIRRFSKLVTALVIMSMACASSGFTAEVVDKVLVVVNDEVITQREFDRAFLPIKQSYEANLQGEDLQKQLDQVRKAFLDQLVNTKIAISMAKKAKVEIDETELKDRIDKVRSYYGSESAFLEALDEKGTNLSEFTKEIREQMMAQEVVDKEVASKIVITPGEVSDLYDKNKEKMVSPHRVKVRGIMVRKGEAEDDEAKKKIEDIQNKLNKGEAFSDLAKKHSEGPYAQNGGEMGYVVQGQLLQEMDQAIFNTDKGKDTGIVETRIGYHIFMIEDIEEPRNLELAEVSEFLKGQLFRRKFEEELVKWLEEKRKNAYISFK